MGRVETRDPTTSDVVMKQLRGSSMDWTSIAFQSALLLCLLVSLAILVVLLVDVFSDALPVFQERGTEFVRSGLSSLAERAGIWQGLVGSLMIAVTVIVVSFPLGIAAAVYLEEFAPDTRWSRFITVNIRNLAGVPAVVYGILGVTIFVKALRGFTAGPTLLTGGLVMAVLVLPIVIITASEALRAVPHSIREAGYGVGATRWEVVRSHVLPAAAPGILTGTVLSLSRALGETAPLLLVGAITGFIAFGDQSLYEMLYSSFTSLPTIVFGWARQPSADFRELTSAAIVVLLLVTLTANAAAILLRNRYERKW
jgi:phosphate transport system permease protein